jgi:hypothetical protein
MFSSPEAVADGLPGILAIVGRANQVKDIGSTQPVVREVALLIARPQLDHDQAGQIASLANFVMSAVVYVMDPLHVEYMQAADLMLADIFTHGRTSGDCDDHCILFGALAQSLGIPVEIVAVKTSAEIPTPNHVIAIAHPDSGPVEIDLCAKNGERPVYPEKFYA